MISHAERLRATLNNERCDRPPIALWRHFPLADQTPSGLAAATLAFQAAYDWDIVKVSPSSSFCLRDWGAQDQPVSMGSGRVSAGTAAAATRIASTVLPGVHYRAEKPDMQWRPR